MSKSIAETHNENLGLMYGVLGVLGFSGTLPATRIAVTSLDPNFVGLGRGVFAGILAIAILSITRQPIPHKKYWGSLGIITAGVIVGFPIFSAWAMRQLPASHGAIIIGVLPLATAIAGALRAGEKPSWGFWIASICGSATIVTFAVIEGNGRLQFADLALMGAVISAALGYAEGGKLSRVLGGWQVICWALVFAAPILIIPVGWIILQNGVSASYTAWLGFAYVGVVSMLLAFFAWYHGLAIGGIARVGQLQLLQPFITIFISALLLGEEITTITIVTAVIVVLFVAVGRKQSITL